MNEREEVKIFQNQHCRVNLFLLAWSNDDGPLNRCDDAKIKCILNTRLNTRCGVNFHKLVRKKSVLWYIWPQYLRLWNEEPSKRPHFKGCHWPQQSCEEILSAYILERCKILSTLMLHSPVVLAILQQWVSISAGSVCTHIRVPSSHGTSRDVVLEKESEFCNK